jgi:hypothetical protein
VRAAGWSAALAVAAAAALAGCAAPARYVALEPGGGTVAIASNTPEQHAQALALVASRCPQGYDIVREEEFVTGTEVSNERRTEYDRTFDETRTSQNVRSRVRTEWRITFSCK